MTSERRSPGHPALDAQILEATVQVGKTYGFDERHDHTKPIDVWFQRSDEGLVLVWAQVLG